MLADVLTQRFKLLQFRPHQEAVCATVTQGRHALLVMPTGAGKSLCYQVPSVARKYAGLVISPLIALMDDQTQKLKKLGFRAEAIHSGRPREETREVCRAYLRGHLDFLFIAPERLAVPGFGEMLAKRPLSLVAVDEAHCISQWGHDFRPDYRLLQERLKGLPDCPWIAMTATATPQVQDDIISQLGLPGVERFIHGFRRPNLAIRVEELEPAKRPRRLLKLLQKSKAVPAIVYAPTRNETEEIAEVLADEFKVSPYHAGLPIATREKVQREFLEGKLDVIVATIAFGMGIDKADIRSVVHFALPSTVEGYYQEIGRAGRDGQPAQVILFHSASDRDLHEYFFKKDYPDVDTLLPLFDLLPKSGEKIEYTTWTEKLRHLGPELQTGLNRLKLHQGIVLDGVGRIGRGSANWRKSYLNQRSSREKLLRQMPKWVKTPGCRMLNLIEYFGDQTDAKTACGVCDRCSPVPPVVRRRAR